MPVMFKTQQGRTLYRSDLDSSQLGPLVFMDVEIFGYEYGDLREIPIHARGKYVVEWWDTDWQPWVKESAA